MMQLLIGSFLLGMVRELVPNHWIPMVLLGKAEQWTKQQVILVTALAVLAHASSIILLGALIGMLRLELAREYILISTATGPLLLVFMGLVFFTVDFRKSKHMHLPEKRRLVGKPPIAIISILFIAIFFSLCQEIEASYFNVGAYGWRGILLISIINLFVSVLGMLLLVSVGFKGLEHFNFQFLNRHEM